MKVAVFGSKPYDETYLTLANEGASGAAPKHELKFFSARLDETTATLARGFDAVCIFVNDCLNRAVIDQLAEYGVRHVALRCAGFNQVDVPYAKSRGFTLARVPAYSPHAVAEHAVALLLTLNRRIHKAYNRVREGNFELGGLMGFDLVGKTVTVVGTGKIGSVFAKIMHGFGCKVLAVDQFHNPELLALGMKYVRFEEALPLSDVISLHCPLTEQTRHLLHQGNLEKMKKGVLIINTGRGALVDTKALIEGLKSGVIGGLGLDVYEQEETLFFSDRSQEVISDDVFMRLTTFPNVLVTGHQAFFTHEALTQIAQTTIGNLTAMEQGAASPNLL